MVKSALIENLTPEAVNDSMRDHRIVLVDVREPYEYAAERIHGALNFPLSSFDPAALPVAEGKSVVLQCGTGRRSATAVAACAKADVPVTAHLAGGITAWKAAGLPIVTTDPATGQTRDV
ncbi:MAG: sulfurtransferase [Rhodospirillaceae bacterium]|nr:sulfurtransferase [Rhodospirillaceae bacterium]